MGERGRKIVPPGSMGGSPCTIASQTIFDLPLPCDEKDSSKTQAVTVLPVKFVTAQLGPFSPVTRISILNLGRSGGVGGP